MRNNNRPFVCWRVPALIFEFRACVSAPAVGDPHKGYQTNLRAGPRHPGRAGTVITGQRPPTGLQTRTVDIKRRAVSPSIWERPGRNTKSGRKVRDNFSMTWFYKSPVTNCGRQLGKYRRGRGTRKEESSFEFVSVTCVRRLFTRKLLRSCVTCSFVLLNAAEPHSN